MDADNCWTDAERGVWVDVNALELKEVSVEAMPTTRHLVRVRIGDFTKAVPAKHVFPLNDYVKANECLRDAIDEELGRVRVNAAHTKAELAHLEKRQKMLEKYEYELRSKLRHCDEERSG